jgi:hypothetical protein
VGISAELRTAADELDGYYKTDTAGWTGAAVEQYRVFCADRVNLYEAAAGAAAATANLINRNKLLLTIVRSIVRDLITDGVGKVISIALRYPPPVTPAASVEVAAQVTRTGNSIVDLVRKLQQALANAGELVRRSGQIFSDVRQIYRMGDKVFGTYRHLRNPAADALRDVAVAKGLNAVAGTVRDAGRDALAPVLKESGRSIPERFLVEAVKEPTKYGDGRADETPERHDR